MAPNIKVIHRPSRVFPVPVQQDQGPKVFTNEPVQTLAHITAQRNDQTVPDPKPALHSNPGL